MIKQWITQHKLIAFSLLIAALILLHFEGEKYRTKEEPRNPSSPQTLVHWSNLNTGGFNVTPDGTTLSESLGNVTATIPSNQ